MNYVVKIVTLLLLPQIMLASCTKKPTENAANEVAQQQKVKKTGVKTTDQFSQVESQTTKNAIMLFDISKSMKGYIDGLSPEFRGVISGYSKMINAAEYYEVGAKPNKSKAFIKNLSEGKFDYSGVSDFLGTIGYMTEQVLSDSVDMACLVSDGIMSGTDAQIRNSRNRMYNIQSRDIMKDKISESLEKLDSTYSALILRYEATFDGIYYCYNNDHQTLQAKSRPYFAIFIGKHDKVKKIEQNVITGQSQSSGDAVYQYTDIMMIGDAASYNNCKFGPKDGIIPAKDPKGALKIQSKDTISFSCDIKSLPAYMQTSEYFESNFVLKYKRQPKNEFSEVPRNKYNLYVDAGRHRVIVSFSKVSRTTYVSGNTLCFELKYAVPTWISTLSDNDDSDIFKNKDKKNKTFNLQYLIDGFKVLNNTDIVIKTEMQFI